MESKEFLYYIFAYYHNDLLYQLFSDDEKTSDYLRFEKVQELTKEFLKSGIDNEDEDIEDTTREFLNQKIEKLKEK